MFYLSVNCKFLYDQDRLIYNENTQYPVCYGQHTVDVIQHPPSTVTFVLELVKTHMSVTVLKAAKHIVFAIANDHGINQRILPGQKYACNNYDTLSITSA